VGTRTTVGELPQTGGQIQQQPPGRSIKAQEDEEKKVRGQAFPLRGFLTLPGDRMQSQKRWISTFYGNFLLSGRGRLGH
jgi:hypothetical protein